jgi:DNA polymerase III sliding clamp (beta) subunit (PCNA family)
LDIREGKGRKMTPETATVGETALELEFENGEELGRALHNASLFASKDPSRPILCSILLQAGASEKGKTTIVAVGCDSYVLGTDTVEAKGSTPGFKVALAEGPALKAAIKALNAKTRAVLPALFKIEERQAVVTTVDSTFRLPLEEGQYPNWEQLIPEEITETTSAMPFGLDPKRLAAFLKVKGVGGASSPLAFYVRDPLKPVLIKGHGHGETFKGLIMPVRM